MAALSGSAGRAQAQVPPKWPLHSKPAGAAWASHTIKAQARAMLSYLATRKGECGCGCGDSPQPRHRHEQPLQNLTQPWRASAAHPRGPWRPWEACALFLGPSQSSKAKKAGLHCTLQAQIPAQCWESALWTTCTGVQAAPRMRHAHGPRSVPLPSVPAQIARLQGAQGLGRHSPQPASKH